MKETTFEEFKNNPESQNASTEFDLNFKPDYLYTPEDVTQFKKELMSGKKTFGEPAASLSWGIDGNRTKASLMPGIEGEKQTAKLLDKYALKHPGVYIFHSLSWPESNGDTDHIVVYKDLVILIDTKRWKSQRKYTVTEKNTIKRGTVHFPEGRVKIGYAAKAWAKKIPGKQKIRSVVCIAQEKVFVPYDKNWQKAPFKLVIIDKLEEQLDYMISRHKTEVEGTSTKLLWYFAQTLVKPRNLMQELLDR